jgi:hypothetical protein
MDLCHLGLGRGQHHRSMLVSTASLFLRAYASQLLVTMAVIPASLRYFERLWGTVETLKFIVVCVTLPNLIAFAFNWIEFIATRNADMFL